MNTYSIPRVFVTLLALTLTVLFTVACNVAASLTQQDVLGNITICHAVGDVASPYTELVLAVNELPAHSKHQDDIIPAPAMGCPSELLVNGNDGKIAICHATGDQTHPYNKISVAFSGLDGHGKHENDFILELETADCPNGTPTPGGTATQTGTVAAQETPTETLTPQATLTETPTSQQTATADSDAKITICHATGSKKNPYVLITVSVNGLNGHGDHTGDIIPAPADGCPQK
jgi:hypothetical protein